MTGLKTILRFSAHRQEYLAQLIMIADRVMRRHILMVRAHECFEDLLILGQRQSEVLLSMLCLYFRQRLHIKGA